VEVEMGVIIVVEVVEVLVAVEVTKVDLAVVIRVVVLPVVDTKEVIDPQEVTKEAVLQKEVLIVLPTEAIVPVHLEVTKEVIDLQEVTRVVSDQMLAVDIKEVVLSLTDSEAEQIHSVEYLVEELLLLALLTVLPTEAIVHKQTVLSSKGNERSEEITRKEHTKLLVIETMLGESRKLGQAERKKIYNTKKHTEY
jgi:hypothetical protein